MQDSFGNANAESSVVQLIIDQLEELVVTLVEEIRERPAVAGAILAAVVGALVGTLFATRTGRRRSSPVATAARRARGANNAIDLAGLGVKLLQNPMVRAYALSAIEGQIKKRLSR